MMKRVILATALLFGIGTLASAQTATGNASKTTGAASSTTKSKKAKKSVPSEKMNNRKTYHFKNGQRSTPTGNEATGTGGGYSALGRNRASEPQSDTVSKSRKKQ